MKRERATALAVFGLLFLQAAVGQEPSQAPKDTKPKREDNISLTLTQDGRLLQGPVSDNKDAKASYFIARDWRVVLHNQSGKEVTVTATLSDNSALKPEKVAKGATINLVGSSDRVVKLEFGESSTTVEIVLAKKLEVLSKVGAGLIYNSGDDFSGYKLVDKVNGNGTKIIAKNDQRNFDINVTGQIYVPFDDEAWLACPTVAKVLTFGMFNNRHHRLGLMAGLAAKGDTDPSYQVGIVWFLDPAGRAAVSYGFSFRSRQELQQGLKAGDDFAGTDLPTRREFKPFFFIGLTFNIGK